MDLLYPRAFLAHFTEERRGIYMARIDSAYDYYVSTYGSQKTSRYDAHKKSDLRKVYNNIVKTNKESPLYKISNLDEAKRYAIDIKENAKEIQNVVASLSDHYGGFEDSFQKKVAISSDENYVEAKYVGDGSEDNSMEQFQIEVKELAQPQVNVGNFLKKEALSFVPGSYSFDLDTNAAAYEFQFNVNTGETNADILQKLSNLVNTSNINISANIIEDGSSQALSLVSKQIGLDENEKHLFEIIPATNPESMKAMDLLGIHKISQPASNSSFTLNGHEHSSLSNTFTINNAFELTLKDVTTSPATIGFKTNTDAVADNVQSLVDVYNQIIATSQRYANTGASAGNKLFNDISTISKNNKASLEYIGLIVGENGSLSIDREILGRALEPDRAQNTFETLSNIKDKIKEKAEKAAVNPMNYVNKVVVAYKNPGHNFNTPYISSIYSGMMMDLMM